MGTFLVLRLDIKEKVVGCRCNTLISERIKILTIGSNDFIVNRCKLISLILFPIVSVLYINGSRLQGICATDYCSSRLFL
jgi:hypothetical protein